MIFNIIRRTSVMSFREHDGRQIAQQHFMGTASCIADGRYEGNFSNNTME